MKFDKFSHQIDVLRKRFAEVRQYNNSELVLPQQKLQSAFEEISTVLEELQVAEVDLHQQNKKLCQQNEELTAAQEALQESEERFRIMADTAPVMIWMSGSDKLCNYFNRSWLEFTGRTLEQEIGNGWTLGVHPDDLQDCLNTYTTAFDARQSFSMEYRLKRFDSEYRWILDSGTPRFNQGGSFAGYIGSAIDITERKHVEEQLRLANEFEATLKRITDKVRDSLDEHQILQTAVQELALVLGIICCDAALYNLDESTSTICYVYTASNREEIPITPSSIGRVVQMADVPEVYRQLLQGQYFQFCDLTLDPIRSQVAVLSCPIVDDRRVLGDLWLFNHKSDAFDELEIRLVQQVANQCAIALRQAQLYQAATAQVKELEKLNALKDDFLSTVSHELRTPIANMEMALQMLKVAPTSERRERYLEILQAECNRESQLINDLLDLQQMEAVSAPNLFVEAVSLPEILPGVIEPFQVRTGQRQQSLQINLSSELPMLACKRASLERILAELLNNACKYTPARGEIILSVHYKNLGLLPLPADSASATILRISNSVEIPTAELPHLFEKFYRVPNADRWQQGGTGLGLALVQKLIEQLQGTIQVESSKGWTTFTVQLPNLLKV